MTKPLVKLVLTGMTYFVQIHVVFRWTSWEIRLNKNTYAVNCARIVLLDTSFPEKRATKRFEKLFRKRLTLLYVSKWLLHNPIRLSPLKSRVSPSLEQLHSNWVLFSQRLQKVRRAFTFGKSNTEQILKEFLHIYKHINTTRVYTY